MRYAAPDRFTRCREPLPAPGSRSGSRWPSSTRIFTDLGAARLRPDERLDITVLDVDLAGFDRPGFATPTGLRVVTDRATPPRIRLSPTACVAAVASSRRARTR